MNVLDEAGQDTPGARAVARCRILGEERYSDMSGGLFRPFLGAGHIAAMEQVSTWMQEAGMRVARNPVGTLVGRYEGQVTDAPCLMIGSHIDSVRDGGLYDGVLGVMLGIECVAHFAERGERLPFAIEVVAFGDEEGSRFPLSMLGSRALGGKPLGMVADMTDRDGVSLRDAMAAVGLDVARIAEARRDRSGILAYLEAHIEQGPVLDHESAPVAAVSGIAGIQRFHVQIDGVPGHAGTVPLAMRQDALAAAGEIVLEIETFATRHASSLIATVGRIEAFPGAINVIAGRVVLTVEIRSVDDAVLEGSVDQVEEILAAVSARRPVRYTIFDRQTFAAARCDSRLVGLLACAMEQAGLPRRIMVSGAGHDAMMMTDWVPSAMLFIRSPRGISHHPDETVKIPDVQSAFDVMGRFISDLSRTGIGPGDGEHAHES
ncbi:allantoate amidohydrolase [Gluconacetobacter tumulicola]|uniref:Allantoate amidohydrolase n=1 Tax=Gluconacetobacter tumulicola TaxID=1017177 RepID=A0A7W4JG20_9PROT|nr:allantoate amidohydrolase [Gluconacetobacter tumulicola]MBB2180595.1 allantoate amidohydrolase [Gluconacetobacter tumulicola]